MYRDEEEEEQPQEGSALDWLTNPNAYDELLDLAGIKPDEDKDEKK